MATQAEVKTKPKIDLERTMRRLLAKHILARIVFSVSEKTVYAKAIPQAYHPLVAKRQQSAIREAADTTGSISLSHASAVANEQRDKPIAEAYGDTIEDAVVALERELKALCRPNDTGV